mgnify:CR=1 FL=1
MNVISTNLCAFICRVVEFLATAPVVDFFQLFFFFTLGISTVFFLDFLPKETMKGRNLHRSRLLKFLAGTHSPSSEMELFFPD